MTTFAPRPPLQQLDNPHMMSERGNGRRTSARLAGKDEMMENNNYSLDPVKRDQTTAGGTQSRTNMNSAAAKTGAKRKPSYDEDDDGFTFSRTRSKKAKPAPVEPAIEEEATGNEPLAVAPKVKATRPRKKSFSSPTFPAGEKKRSTRQSSELIQGQQPEKLNVERKRKQHIVCEVDRNHEEANPFKPTRTLRRRSSEVAASPPVEIAFDATKIALPFADTPIIRRNKEMRKGAQTGSRRSSLGNRGRRASSLIESGKSNALPHDEVESSEFYKHIEGDGMPEPRRMRQLLMWCGARALGEKPSFEKEDGNARLAAREIQSQLLKDFAAKSGLSNWFDRRESTPPPQVPKANPKNLSNLAKIQELEQEIARLQKESQKWQSLLRPPAEKDIQILSQSSQSTTPSAIDSTLLTDPNQKAALSALHSFIPGADSQQPSLAATTSSRIHHVTQNLEFEIDKFATNVHALIAYKAAAERVADDALATVAETLERRDREGQRRAGGGETSTRDVLRGLSRIIDR